MKPAFFFFAVFAPAVAGAAAVTNSVADTCSARLLVLDTVLPGQRIEDGYSDDGGSKWNGRSGKVTWLGRLSEQDDLLSEDDSYSLAKAFEHGSNLGLEIGPERLARLGKDVKELADEFVSLAGPSVEDIVEELGPAPEAFNAQAVYVAALLNPIVPINEDFLFIRPAVMTARSTANRLESAERGLRDAIRRLRK